MARERDPFGLALTQLRESLRGGLIAPGQPLLAADLAAHLKVSATPVREALSRLAGEGLVEDRRGRGFYVPRSGAAEIEEFYDLHRSYVALALELGDAAEAAPSPGPLRPAANAVELRAWSERFWSGLVQRARGGVISRAYSRLADQMALVRLFEPLVLTDLIEEYEALGRAAADNSPRLIACVQYYHDRRQAAARALETRLRESAYPLDYNQNII